MTSSRWDAQGNIYLVTEESMTPDRVRSEIDGADGILEVFRKGHDWLEIAIWNPDGSRAEMSGNGTRIAACWLAEQTGSDRVAVRVGPREVPTRMLGGGLVEQDLGEVAIGPLEDVSGIAFVAVDVGNPHAVVDGDPADLPRVGPALEVHERFPRRTNVQVARAVSHDVIEARVWERGVGETASSGSSAVAVAAAFGISPVTIRFPGGDLAVRLDGARAFLTGPAVCVEPRA
jgi:diaminopimelate epimerase